MTSPTPQTPTNDDHFPLLFGVRRSVRYHDRRIRFYESIHTTANFVGVIFGSAAMASILSADIGMIYGVVSAAFVAVVSAVDMVIGSPRMARLHDDLKRRFIALETDMVRDPDSSDQALRAFQARRLEIETEEPSVLRTLDRLCHNELLRAMGYEEAAFIRIPAYQRLLSHLISFEPPRSVTA